MTNRYDKPGAESQQAQKKSKQAGIWSNEQLKAAKDFWSKLSEDELVESAGNKQKLTELVEKRYSIAYEAADKQVNTFFTKHDM